MTTDKDPDRAQSNIEAMTAGLAAIAALSAERDALRAEVSALKIRIDELLASFVRMTRETPYPEEDRAASVLIAEVGTLRAQLAARTAERDENRNQTEAALSRQMRPTAEE